MVGIPNDMLASLASSMKAAEKWVAKNVSTHISSNNVNISKGDCPLNADVYESSNGLPSGGDFRADIHDLMLAIVKFLNDNSAPLPNFERHWGYLLDGRPKYQLNLGATNSGSVVAAQGVHYLEKKWCVMKPSANLDDPQVAPSVSYACGLADCTSLGYGTTCGNLDARGNISYAFNSYYQKHNQLSSACKFANLSMITKNDPTVGSCTFEIMIQPYYGGAERIFGCLQKPLGFAMVHILFLLTSL
ncbi:hypothetical protein FNV43_RR20945 [Rhamnella rubrinervis]|uniref:X8 domain-containing protein n=1 Tax=Rhamnella rubrinervis TaxID=2594499 RepID=A0A8K0E7H2_9ROSA|nr:hypothetical protein FNV43_RR20945 [Rhamnella rubrinervis]